MSELRYEYYANVKEKSVDWLWYPYIPCGKLTILQGDPGEGKSTFILYMIALLTKGLPMPDGYNVGGVQSVVYQCREDGAADTIKPRLMAAGADCRKVAYIVDEEEQLTFDDKRIEEIIVHTKAKLFVLDPIQSFVPQDGDMHSASRMRTLLGNLSAIAERQNCAIVLVGHMNKSSGGKNLYRGLGSIDIAAIARSILMIERDEENSKIRYMYPIKSSLAPEGDAIAFKFDKRHGFQWIGPCEHKGYTEVEESKESKVVIAKRIICSILEDKDMLGKQMMNGLMAVGISERTANNAKKELGVKSIRVNGEWYWSLPKKEISSEEREVIEDAET